MYTVRLDCGISYKLFEAEALGLNCFGQPVFLRLRVWDCTVSAGLLELESSGLHCFGLPVLFSFRVWDCEDEGMFGNALLRAGRRRPWGCLGLHCFGLEDEGLWGCLGLHCFGFGIVRTKSFGIELLRVWDCEDEGFFGGYGSACRYYPPHPPTPPVVESANFTGTLNTPLAYIT